jgi:hypothetical protein
MTRLFPENTPVSVLAGPDGTPVRIQLLDEWHEVEFIANRWRVSTSWWNKDAYANREFHKLATTDGILCTVYRDLDTGAWCIQRIYD